MTENVPTWEGRLYKTRGEATAVLLEVLRAHVPIITWQEKDDGILASVTVGGDTLSVMMNIHTDISVQAQCQVARLVTYALARKLVQDRLVPPALPVLQWRIEGDDTDCITVNGHDLHITLKDWGERVPFEIQRIQFKDALQEAMLSWRPHASL